jgi:hypothetical protein
MPFDTADKRRAAVAPSFAYYNPGVTPSSTHGLLWRQRVAHSAGAVPTQTQHAGRAIRISGRAVVTRGSAQGRIIR